MPEDDTLYQDFYATEDVFATTSVVEVVGGTLFGLVFQALLFALVEIGLGQTRSPSVVVVLTRNLVVSVTAFAVYLLVGFDVMYAEAGAFQFWWWPDPATAGGMGVYEVTPSLWISDLAFQGHFAVIPSLLLG